VEKGQTYAAMSKENGSWELRSVNPGTYKVEVRRPGFAPFLQQVTVPEAGPLQVNVRLDVGRIEETVTVKGEAPASQAPRPVTAQVPGPGTPVQAQGTPTRLRVGGNVQAAKIVRMTRPIYPPQMKEARVTGTVVLQAVISREGNVLNLESISPEVHPDLVEAAMEAVRQWQYEPTLLNGEPVEIVTLININFTLLP
jgi:TonB family protein